MQWSTTFHISFSEYCHNTWKIAGCGRDLSISLQNNASHCSWNISHCTVFKGAKENKSTQYSLFCVHHFYPKVGLKPHAISYASPIGRRSKQNWNQTFLKLCENPGSTDDSLLSESCPTEGCEWGTGNCEVPKPRLHFQVKPSGQEETVSGNPWEQSSRKSGYHQDFWRWETHLFLELYIKGVQAQAALSVNQPWAQASALPTCWNSISNSSTALDYTPELSLPSKAE